MSRIVHPAGWISKPFSKAATRIQTRGGKLKTKEYQESGCLPIVDQGQNLVVAYTGKRDCLFQGPYPVIVFGDHTKNVKLVDFEFAVGADGVVLLRPADENELDIRFLYYWLKYVPLHNLGYSRHFKLLKELNITYPVNLNEQRRIVARIEELTRRAEEARQLRREALEEIDKSLAATVDAVFNERDEDWTVATVKQLCGKPQYGHTASATNEQVGPRFLRITDIQNGHVDWESVPYCSCDKPEKYRLSNGDIVFARTGATTGKSYLVRKPSESVFASYLIRIRSNKRVLPKYIWWYFQGSSYWAAVFSSIDDGNRPNMNGSKLGALKIPFPESKATQRLIVERLDALSQKVAELRRLQADVGNDIAFFLPALLAKAFRGEL